MVIALGGARTASVTERRAFVPRFIEPSAWQDVERFCQARYVECRLFPRQNELDYLMAIERSGARPAASALARALVAASAPQREQWRPLLALFDAWTDGASRLSLQAPAVWLEFDGIQRGDPHAHFPSVSVCLAPGYSARQHTFPNDPSRDVPLIEDVLALLEVRASKWMRGLVSECFQRMPAGGRWIHFSAMLAREPQALKLYGAVPRHSLIDYLDAIGWQGERAAVEGVMDTPYPAELLGDQVFIDLNLSTLGDAASASLGLAVAPQHLIGGPDADPQRRAILRRWCDLGLASAEKIRSVHDVLNPRPRSSEDDAVWPGRFLDLKLVWSAAFGTVAKAYLGFHRQAAELPW